MDFLVGRLPLFSAERLDTSAHRLSVWDTLGGDHRSLLHEVQGDMP